MEQQAIPRAQSTPNWCPRKLARVIAHISIACRSEPIWEEPIPMVLTKRNKNVAMAKARVHKSNSNPTNNSQCTLLSSALREDSTHNPNLLRAESTRACAFRGLTCVYQSSSIVRKSARAPTIFANRRASFFYRRHALAGKQPR